MASLPKICAVALVLAASSSDGRIPPRQTGCSQGRIHPMTSNRLTYGLHPPTRQLINSFFRDPWFDQCGQWRDPLDWGRPLSLSFSHWPWDRAGMSLWGPSLAAALTGDFHALKSTRGCHQRQDDAMGAGEHKGESELRQERRDLGCQGQCQEADNQREAQGDLNQREEEQQWMKTKEMIVQRRLQQERERLRKEAELRRLEEERRLQDEMKEQRRQEEDREMKRRRQEEQRLRKEAELHRLEEERRLQDEMKEQQWRQEEDREMRRRKQEEQRLRQRQEEEAEAMRNRHERERLRGRRGDSAHGETRPRETARGQPHQGMKTNTRYGSEEDRNQRQQYKKVQVATLAIPGYSPEDVSVMTSGNRLMVRGKHVCDCHEKCTEREFQRSFTVPRSMDPASLGATLAKDGQLTITGSQGNPSVRPTDNSVVAVEGDGSFAPRPRHPDPTCGGRRKGFKLKKMNKRAGEIVEDYEDLVAGIDNRTFEDEVDEDGVTMEVED